MAKPLVKSPAKPRSSDARTPVKARGQLRDAAGRLVVQLHIYDVSSESAAQRVNDLLRPIGMGAFHAAVEVLGEEYSFGYCTGKESGVFSCAPRRNSFHRYRESLEMGVTALTDDEVKELIEKLEEEWPGRGYDLLSRNCCHFSSAMCQALGVGDIPEWVTSLAGAGASVRTGVDQAQAAAQANATAAAMAAARLAAEAAEEAGKLDDRYRITGSIDDMATREIAIDEQTVGAAMQAIWARASEKAGWVGSMAEKWFDEAQKPTSFDPRPVENTAAGLWAWATGVGPAVASRRPLAPSTRSDGARCRGVLPGPQSPSPERVATPGGDSPAVALEAEARCAGSPCLRAPPPPASLGCSPKKARGVGKLSSMRGCMIVSPVVAFETDGAMSPVQKVEDCCSPGLTPEALQQVARPTLLSASRCPQGAPLPSTPRSAAQSPRLWQEGDGVEGAPSPPPVARRVIFQAHGGPQAEDSEEARSGAKRQAEYAASALDFQDVATARKCLRFALRSLEAPEAAILEEEEPPEATDAPSKPPPRVLREAQLRAQDAAASLEAGDVPACLRSLREASELLAAA